MIQIKGLLIRFLVILLAIQGAIAAQLINLSVAHGAEGTPEVVINEVMWMGTVSGSTLHSADEWIELRNTTDSPIDLSGWKLTNASSAIDGILEITSGTIPASGYFLISNYAQTSSSSVLDVEPDLVTTSIQLSNTCAPIVLTDSLGETVDEMGCDGTSYFAGSNTATKAALERNIVIESGSLSGSWHTSVGFTSLDDSATNTLATPKFVNDTTTPLTLSAAVNDGSGEDKDFLASTTTLETNWSGFSDSESGVTNYLVGLGTVAGQDDVVAFSSTPSTSHIFSSLTLSENTTHYVVVKAVNGVGLESSVVSSDGITVNTADPEAPTGVVVTDAPSDNGGSVTVSWLASPSPDVVRYQLSYQKQGDIPWTSVIVEGTSALVSGLENSPAAYRFALESIDFNNQYSSPSEIVTGQAQDNLAPVLDVTKVVVEQKAPGATDAIYGQAGASNEPLVTVNVFDRNPAETGANLINSVQANANGSFSAMGIGDNKHGTVWVQLVDQAGNSSTPKSFSNDILAPDAPNLQLVKSSCLSDPCRVHLEWSSSAADVDYYRVGYTPHGGSEELTLEIRGTQIDLDLPAHTTYQFQVYAYDQYGNKSVGSNVLEARLTPGVATTVTLKEGQAFTQNEAIGGAPEVQRTTVSRGLRSTFFAPTQAAGGQNGTAEGEEEVTEDTQSGNGSANGEDGDKEDADVAGQDWIRILTVVALLLIIAGSFYALSRSVGKASAPVVVEEGKPVKRKGPAATKRKGRGRPPGSKTRK